MQFKILGSGGAIPIPRPFCQCEVCNQARLNSKLKRNSSCASIGNVLIDCPEDISDSLNRNNITNIDYLFLTHWHPDHTFGLRVVLEANYDFISHEANKVITVCLGKKVYKTLKEKFPVINYYVDVLKVAKLKFIEDKEIIKFNGFNVTVVGYKGPNSDWYAFLINDKLLYSSCDTIEFDNYKNFKNLDYWVTECGIFSVDTEISFSDMLLRIKELNPKYAILTHIEEPEINKIPDDIGKVKLGYDGMVIELS
ncbi:MBL fold metallo-hydrolase [Candidatus Woesearchaeota archaeon]|nr:MBL fold metallo-hydrolase [Candidatus Woesearchaeota archaeon]